MTPENLPSPTEAEFLNLIGAGNTLPRIAAAAEPNLTYNQVSTWLARLVRAGFVSRREESVGSYARPRTATYHRLTSAGRQRANESQEETTNGQ